MAIFGAVRGVTLDAVASCLCPCQGRKAQNMTLIHRIQHNTTQAIFAALWVLVLLTHFNPVDKRLMQGNPANNAPKPAGTRLCLL